MGDSNRPRSKGIPSWQLPAISETSKPSEMQQPQPSEHSILDSRASLIEKASRFLDDNEIREASKERKIYFLQIKGLTDEEIGNLLAEKEHMTEAEVVRGVGSEKEASSRPNNAATPAQPIDADITDDYVNSDAAVSQTQDGLPIITYPEFLMHSQKPPPLITTSRLLTALYFASGAAATMYGLSNYVIEPMVESLSSARHSFFENASTNIDKLNEKLESTVSKIPNGVQGEDEVDGANGSFASLDAARFFSRTIATQTSPRLSRSSSSTSLPEKTSPSAVATHASHMSRIYELLSDLKDEDGEAPDPVKDNVRAFRDYLDNLPSWGRTGFTGAKVAVKNNDGVAKVKAEIKSVKGSLLSARNFPSGITSR